MHRPFRPRALRVVVVLATGLALGLGAGCPSVPQEICDLSTEDPLVVDRHLTAVRDGEPFDEEGSYGPGPNASLDAGLLSVVIARDENGSETDDLVARGVFPICIRVGARSDRSGSASFESSFVSDDEHTGSVALLQDDGGLLVGRFSLELRAADGTTTSFTDGAFRLPVR